MNNDFQYPAGVRNELKRRSLEKHGILLCGICGLAIEDNGKYGNRATMNLDHIIPKSRGGLFAIDNMQLAHVACNTKKADGSLPHST
jgi:5-methylcytosine-specific restriction endonuclease McrA